MAQTKNPDKKTIDRLVSIRRKHHDQRSTEKLFRMIRKGDKTALSTAITISESDRKQDQQLSDELLRKCLKYTGNSVRIGITGVPGVGKSTFIDAFGSYLIRQGKKVAVLAVDPSSEKSGGSILGDKTRMTNLSVNEHAFIRPSASRGSLGGVAHHTRESILLCEAAGYDVILVETVGVGQSETVVKSMTDFFLLLMLSGAGDELQGIKKGIMEMADAIIITKADGDNVKKANLARAEYMNALHLARPNTNQWIPKVETSSALTGKGMDTCWNIISKFTETTTANGYFNKTREEQNTYWMHDAVKEIIVQSFYTDKKISSAIVKFEKELISGKITSKQAALKLAELFLNGKKNI